MTSTPIPVTETGPRWAWLPAPRTWKYYALLGVVGIFILGPLGGVAASYMNFSLGFFVGGQVLAGILGSTVTYGYGAQGRHGANYIQTTAASVAGMSAMAVVIQASRQFAYQVSRLMAKGEGTLEAAMVKAYVCRAAEYVTREALQIHGGMGYAEEFPVSRYFVDARVLSIFEGADETLALRLITRRLVDAAGA